MTGMTEACAARCIFGESPRWDDRGRLLWIDMIGNAILELDVESGSLETAATGREITAIQLRDDDGLIVVTPDGLALIDTPGVVPEVAVRIDAGLDTTLNDATTDHQGRLWTASAAPEGGPPIGSLWCVDANLDVTKAAPGVDHANGLAVSPAGDVLYHADSRKGVVEAYALDADRGRLDGPAVVAQIDPGEGVPDGLAVDAEGGIWVALYGGGQVRRYSSDGRLDAVLKAPVPGTTSCAFGGPDLTQLYVTTGDHTTVERSQGSLTGAVLVAEPGVRGLPIAPFAVRAHQSVSRPSGE